MSFSTVAAVLVALVDLMFVNSIIVVNKIAAARMIFFMAFY